MIYGWRVGIGVLEGCMYWFIGGRLSGCTKERHCEGAHGGSLYNSTTEITVHSGEKDAES